MGVGDSRGIVPAVGIGAAMSIQKRYRWEIDVVDTNGREYRYTVGPCETAVKAMRLAMKAHGENRVQWVGNAKITR